MMISGRLLAVMRKEFIHIIRDPRSLVLIFLWPVIMVLLYGTAITFDIKEIRIGVLDFDHSRVSRELLRDLTASDYFRISGYLDKRSEIDDGFLKGRFTAVLVIPAGFEKQKALNTGRIQLIVDGSNSNTATVVIQYFKSFCMLHQWESGVAVSAPLSLHPRVWYNPDLKSAHFIVPGLIAVILMMICAQLTSITLAREWETGTFEQILVSPVLPHEIILGKLAPYLLLSLSVSVVTLAFSVAVFKVPFRGSLLLLLVLSIVYIYASLSIGVLISTRARTQQVALLASQILTLLPSFLLSGFIFPVLYMPLVLKAVTYLVPARYYLVIIRGIMLKGVGPGDLAQPCLLLVLFGTFLIAFSIHRFKTVLEKAPWAG
ncbi:ABC transporter permease [bacterium]|nr:ABC transporter permease [bacterium]